MKDPWPPRFSATSADPRDTIRRLNALGVFPREAPEFASVDDEPFEPYDFEKAAARAVRRMKVMWPQGQGTLGFDRKGLARFGLARAYAAAGPLRGVLEAIPFRWLSAASLSSQWGPGGEPTPYFGPGFGEGHHDLGWACAFKGDGHDQLVSRRWLEHGPWRLVRGANDVSLVQFHDVAATDDEALQQATPGHRAMGITPEGGFIAPAPWKWEFPALRSLYDSSAQVLTVVVMGRTVAPGEMLEACAIRCYQPLEYPVKNVAFVFPREEEARAHLHALWLRGLECRAIVDGREVRLDETYSPPPPEVPDWVKAVRGREGF
jgi:hypothetical protein